MDDAGMILLIDAGNTRIKFGRLDRKKGRREPGSLALAHAELDRLTAWLGAWPGPVSSVLGVNVAGASMAARINDLLAQYCDMPVQWVRSTGSVAGIRNLYEDPAQLGTDRWVSLVGLAARTPAAAILASFGTATTIDTLGPLTTPAPVMGDDDAPLESGRRFEGGIILPGPELMRQSLANGTADLPYAEGASTPFPRNTHAAISSGIAAAQAGAVFRQWQAAKEALGEAPQLYCTGGGWHLVADEVSAELARRRAELHLAPATPQWLDAPVLDGLTSLALAA